MTLEKVPSAYGILKKVFWGVWAPQRGIETAIWRGGKKRDWWMVEKSPWENVVYAALVGGRVKHKIHAVKDVALECFVDSILTRERLPESDALGGWRCVEQHDGLFVDGPRLWRDREGKWVRHAGIQSS